MSCLCRLFRVPRKSTARALHDKTTWTRWRGPCTINEHVEVVLFVGPNRPLPPKVGFKPPVTLEEMKSRGLEGFFTVVGDHTQKAMNQLARKFKNNPKWAKLSAVVYVCQRNNDSYAALKSWGILDNIKGEKRVTVSLPGQDRSLARGLSGAGGARG